MTNETKKEIIQAIEEYADNEGLSFRDNYSGRCMFGRKCVGIITASIKDTITDLSLFLMEELELSRAEVARTIGEAARTDNMGYDYIIYWPDLSAEDAA